MEIRRDYYIEQLKLRKNNHLVKVITGIRRCGKSYLLNKLYYDYLLSMSVKESHIIKVALDDLESAPLLDANKLYEYILNKIIDNDIYYVFLDEIQEVKDFVPLLNSLIKKDNLDVYITGSNSKFLSSDIITEFRGRGDEIHVNPLTFKEYYDAINLEFDEALNEYITYGGMPFILYRETETMKMDYLSSLYQEIYLKDIKERYNIKNDMEMGELLDILSSSIGSLTNPIKLEHTFKSVKAINISKTTINNYLKIFQESYLLRCASRYDIKGKKYINSPKKYYFTDLGLRNARLNFRQNEETHLMENAIYNELIARGYLVDVGVVSINEKNENNNYIKKQIEVDFVANKGSKRYYIQSCYHLLDKEEKELRPLLALNDSFKKIIIVRDNIKLKRDDNGIITMGLKEFLLDNDSLDR
ncbi:MAG: ATP-binding protein [Bacilli bacterium]|nr:ATP-binding protein [Bacilli bacterium]